MKQQSNPQPVFFWLLLATLFLTACGGGKPQTDEAAVQRSLAAANELLYEGEVALALARLEELEQEFPGDPDIVEALAFAYAKQPDPGMAAIYFDQAHSLNPENVDLALYAARAYQESGNYQAASQAYRAYIEANPTDAVALKALARSESELNRNKAALDAFLEAFRASRQQPSPEEAALIGHLYHALDNSTQAARWYKSALVPEAAPNDRLTAQLGLFDLALREKDWPRSYERMEQIDLEFPGELAASPYASSRRELIKWKEAQQKLATTRVTGTTQPEPEPEPEPIEVEEAETVAVTEVEESTTGSVPAGPSLGNLSDATDLPAAKGQPTTVDLTADMEAAGDIDEPNDPDSLTAEEVTMVTETVEVTEDGEVEETTITTTETIREPAPEAIRIDRPLVRTFAERGDLAYEAEDYVTAIRYYRQALADDTRNADLAYRLSRAYYNQGQYREAELFASEATRLQPDDVRYTLNYLRAIQRTMGREALMRELIRAKERFPNSPDVTLALGRAYEIILGNTRNARFLYEEFLVLAPQHPRAEDIRDKLRTMPR